MKTIQKDKKNQIIVELENGRSIREVAALFGVSKSYIHGVRKSVTKVLKNNVGGRKPKLSLQSQRYCTRLITSGGLKSTNEVAIKLNTDLEIDVSRHTIARALKLNGLNSFEKQCKPKLSLKNVSGHLSFANIHKN